jgi:topoisomerase IA-like protein
MEDEFKKQKTVAKVTLGKDPETGVIILDEDPQWVWIREGEGGNYIELRLDKEYGYQLNIKQNDFEIIDFELEGIENAINIIQAQ